MRHFNAKVVGVALLALVTLVSGCGCVAAPPKHAIPLADRFDAAAGMSLLPAVRGVGCSGSKVITCNAFYKGKSAVWKGTPSGHQGLVTMRAVTSGVPNARINRRDGGYNGYDVCARWEGKALAGCTVVGG